MNILKKLIFIIKRPQVVLITGKGRFNAYQTISHLLDFCSEKEEILLFESDLSNPKKARDFSFYLKKSKKPILLVTHFGEVFPDKIFFGGDKEKTNGENISSDKKGKEADFLNKEGIPEIKKIARSLPDRGFLVLNFDDEIVREVKNEIKAKVLTYGFQERADIKASDVNVDIQGTNFKINIEENIIPFWIRRLFGKEHIYSILAAVALSKINNINLVKLSQSFKNYKSLPGKMKLIDGIKKSFIIDNSQSATFFSTIEALNILGGLKDVGGRKIAVLGDLLGIGKYTVEAHEKIGEKAAKVSDFLITIGLRAKFIAQGAENKGMPNDNIFQFDESERAKKYIQELIKENDLILIDGSKEIKIGEVVEEIKA